MQKLRAARTLRKAKEEAERLRLAEEQKREAAQQTTDVVENGPSNQSAATGNAEQVNGQPALTVESDVAVTSMEGIMSNSQAVEGYEKKPGDANMVRNDHK